MTENLRTSLDDLAEEVTVVDLRDRVLRGARRITVRNRAIGALTVAAVLGGSLFAASPIVRRSGPPAPPATSRSATPVPSASPSGSASPTPSGTGQIVPDVR